MLARKSFSAVERSDKKPNDCAPTRKVNTASVVSGSANSKGLKARTATQCSNTTFSDAYSKGLIPCKLLHGSVSNKLGWSVESLGELSFDPLLVNFFEGLVDTRHPYAFLVAQGIPQLLSSPGAYEKICPLLPALVKPLRNGLGSSEKSVVLLSLKVLSKLAQILEMKVSGILPSVLPPLASKMHNKKMKI
ncbi:MAG: hypothetical protein SGCHY_005055, partial [Lobulomycetales sp.]